MSSCCATFRRADRAAVEIADPRAGRSAASRCGDFTTAIHWLCLYRRVLAYRCPDRRTAGAQLAHFVALDTRPAGNGGPLPRSDGIMTFIMHVWRSVRAGGDTKTRKSRRTLKLAAALRRCAARPPDTTGRQSRPRAEQVAGQRPGVPVASGSQPMPRHVLRAFRTVVAAAGLDPHEWTPRELRHSSSRCFQMPTCRSSRSPAWSATAVQPRQRRSTGSRSAR